MKKGFTLIELLGVIAIIGLLLAFAIPKLVSQVKNSSDKVDNATKEMIYSAAELYITDHKEDYPKTQGSSYFILINNLIDEGYLKSQVKINDEDISDKYKVEANYNKSFSFDLVDINKITQ